MAEPPPPGRSASGGAARQADGGRKPQVLKLPGPCEDPSLSRPSQASKKIPVGSGQSRNPRRLEGTGDLGRGGGRGSSRGPHAGRQVLPPSHAQPCLGRDPHRGKPSLTRSRPPGGQSQPRTPGPHGPCQGRPPLRGKSPQAPSRPTRVPLFLPTSWLKAFA